MQIVLVGAGRLATQLSLGLHAAGHTIVQVYSHTSSSAQALAHRVEAQATADLYELTTTADVYIVAVKDAVLSQVAASMGQLLLHAHALVLHTAGSVPLSVLASHGFGHYGVFYPMQSFSKERRVAWEHLPIFIEADSQSTLQRVHQLAATLTDEIYELSSERRRHLHLAAVFACNFVNHCYDLAAQLLAQQGLPFHLLLPLIGETASKVESMSPHEAQTGPAIRYDENVIEAQCLLLADHPLMQQLYELMSRSIHEQQKFFHHD